MKKSLLVLSFAVLGVFANASVDMNHIDNIGASLGTMNNFGVMAVFTDFPTFSGMTLDDFNASGSVVTHVGVAFETASTAAQLATITGWQISFWSSTAAAAGSGNSLNGGTVAQQLIAGPGTLVSLSGTSALSPAYRVDFTGLNINLGATGHYWVGVAPVETFASSGQQFILANSSPAVLGAGTANDAVGVNPGNGFGLGTSVQDNQNAAYMVETRPVPEPASIIALSLGGLALLRRRRKVA